MKNKTLPFAKAVRAALLVLLLAVAGLIQVNAQAFTVGNLNYSVNEDGATVTVTGHVDDKNATGELVIPESVELYGTSYPVTAIGSSAFDYCSGLTGSLVIPNSVTTIGFAAFWRCTGFTGDLTIGNSVQTIAGQAFEDCGFQGSLTLPDGIQSIAHYSFCRCGFTGTLMIPESITSIGYYAFQGCAGFTELNYNATSCDNFSSNHWLSGCSSISTVNIGENVQVIPGNFLNGCSSITGSLNIPESVTSIGENAFNGCSGFTGSLTIPNSVSSIGANAFSSCSGFSGTLTLGSSLSGIGNSAFFGACGGFEALVVLSETPPVLGSNVFVSADYGIPVTVPSCTAGAYQNASGWSDFTNIQESSVCTWEVSATVNPSEGGSVSGAGTYEQGETCTLTATPNGDYNFVNWTENGVEVGTETDYTFTVTGNRSLVANFILPYYTIVADANSSEGGAVDFYPEPVFDFDDGTVQGWTAIDVDGDGMNWQTYYTTSYIGAAHSGSYVVSSWSWNNSSYNPDNYLISPELKNAYNIKYYVAVNTQYPDHYGVFASTTGNDISDFVLVFEETPYSKGQGEGNRVSMKDMGTRAMSSWFERTLALPAGTKYVAFRHFNSYDMNYLFIDDISISSSSAMYQSGNTCTLTAIPNEGYVFTGWEENGTVISTDAEISFTVTGDRSFVANFTPQYEVAVFVNPAEGGSVNGAGSYLEGETCSLTAVPNDEYVFVNWTEYGEEISTDLNYIFAVTSNRELVANFRNLRHNIFVSIRPEAGGVVNAEGLQEDGTVIQTFDFEDGMQGWTTIDADGDGYHWFNSMDATNYGSLESDAHGGSHYVASMSYMNNYGAMSPDNYLVSPRCLLGGTIAFYARAQEPSWAAEHFGVAVSTTGNTNSYDFTTIQEWTLSAKGGGTHNQVIRGNNRDFGNWYYYTVDLSAYAGQEGYVAIRHFNCYDMFWINVDDVEISYNSTFVSHLEGETCTLTAIPNEGWAFYNWSENGEEVSTDAEYSFTVTTDRSLMARFKNPNTIDFVDANVEAISVSLWDTDGDGFLSYDEAAAVTDLGTAFQNNTEITSFDELQYFTGLTAIANNAFYGCGNLVSVTLPDGITSIGDYAFRECVSWTGNLVIPNSVISIGHNAFYHCYGLSGELTIPDAVQTIGIGVFIDCGFTGTLTIGKGLTSIGNATFRRLNINEVHWNAVNCTYAGDSYWDATVFAECYNLTTLVLDDEVETIPDGVFSQLSGLTQELTIPNSVSYIGSYAFLSCSGLMGSLVIPNSVTYIGYAAFAGCSGFEGTLTIGEAVSYIESYAFEGTYFNTMNFNAVNCETYFYEWNGGFESSFVECNSITQLNIGETVQHISANAFRNLDHLSGTLTLPNSLKTIGEKAFYNCFGFDGIDLGNGVESIGNEAFRNCSGIRGELTLPASLQSVGTYAFADCDEISTINYNATQCYEMGNAQQPVFFDCASIAHINIGANVMSIPNYAFKRCSTVTDMNVAAVAPPIIEASTFATVSRAIPVIVPFGSANDYRAAQYWEEFFNITEDGGLVDSYHWEVDAHQYAHNLSVIGVIQINGVEQTSPALEIGAFCGDECRGRQLLTAYPELNRSLVFLTVYGEEGDLITFRLYDHAAEEESTLACATVVAFEADAIVGSYAEPEVLNFVEMQTTAIEAGWTWFSTYVAGDGAEMLQMMEESLGESGVIIKSHTDGFVSYDEFGWDGTLESVAPESMYMVNTGAPAVVSITGAFANTAEHPITLSPEWNWIGFPSVKASSVNNVLSGFTAQDGDVIKTQEGFSQYIEGTGWTGALRTLVPSVGMMYHSLNGSETTLTYTVNAKEAEVEKNVTSEGNHWVPDMKAYPYNMSVLAVVEIDGVELGEGRYELAAFCGGECRGSVRLMEVSSLNRWMAFLTVSGSGTTEMEFALYDTETGMEYRGGDLFRFEQNAIMGSAKEPVAVRFAGLTGTAENLNKVTCYPNPVGRSQYVYVNLPAAGTEARVEVVNALGAVVSMERATGMTAEVKAPSTAGVYVVRVVIDGKAAAYSKLVVE